MHIIDLKDDLKIHEVKKSEVGGKSFVMSLAPAGSTKEKILFSATTETNFNKWMKSFKGIKEGFEQQKQREKELFKQEMSSAAVKKDRVQNAFGVTKPKQEEKKKTEEKFDLGNLFMAE